MTPRPVYETPADKKAEFEIALAWASKFGLTFTHHKDRFHPYDVTFLRLNSKVAIVEVKDCRSYAFEDWPSYPCDVAKLDPIAGEARSRKLKSGLLVRWNCGTIGISLGPWAERYPVEPWGRRDRDDPRDERRPCYFIPREKFKLLD
jgi:hypothetical protein